MSSGSTEVLGKIVVVRDVSITSFNEKLQHQSTILEPTQTCERLAVLTGQKLLARDLVLPPGIIHDMSHNCLCVHGTIAYTKGQCLQVVNKIKINVAILVWGCSL